LGYPNHNVLSKNPLDTIRILSGKHCNKVEVCAFERGVKKAWYGTLLSVRNPTKSDLGFIRRKSYIITNSMLLVPPFSSITSIMALIMD
jgi:hypothetical protein